MKNWTWAAGLIAGWACCTMAIAAAPAPAPALPAELFFKPPSVQQVVLSPGGKRMALSTRGGNGRYGVYVVDLQGSAFKSTRAVLFADADVPAFQWVDDERLVFSITDMQIGLADGRDRAPGLYAVRHDGDDLTELVEVRGRPWIGGSGARTLAWNHMLLHVPQAVQQGSGGARPDEVVIGELQFSGAELRHIQPMWLNIRSGRTRTMAMARLPCETSAWWFSVQGTPRAVQCQASGRTSLHWYQPPRDDQPGAWTAIAEGPLGALPVHPEWVGEGDSLYVLHPGGKAGEAVIAPFDFAKKMPGETLVIAHGFDFDGELIGDTTGQRLLGVRVRAEAEQTVWFNAAHKQAQALADAALPGRVNRIVCRRCGSADAVMLVRSFSDQDPGQLLLWRQADDGGQGAWHRVGQVRPDIEPARMARTDLERIRARDGRDLPVWLTRPRAGKQPWPAVVLVHGGPWLRGRHWDWQDLPQFLAARGYLVIEPEFRGSDGYGQAHLRAGFKQWGQAMQDDLADALLWARQQGLASDAACIIGGSYGGYATLMGLVRHPELYRCGSAWVAVTDPFLLLEGSWRVMDDISDSGRRYTLPQMVGDAVQDREMLQANSPLVQAARIQRPLQLVWGSADRRVPIAHGERLRDAMQKAGQQPEWVVYDGEAHGWRKPEHQIDFAQKLDAFLARHLGAAARAP